MYVLTYVHTYAMTKMMSILSYDHRVLILIIASQDLFKLWN